MTAPDLDALAGLLERYRAAVEADAHNMADAIRTTYALDDLRDAAVNALPALLATARRERRLREALAEVKQLVADLPHPNNDSGVAVGERHHFEYLASRIINAALAEEGQDG